MTQGDPSPLCRLALLRHSYLDFLWLRCVNLLWLRVSFVGADLWGLSKRSSFSLHLLPLYTPYQSFELDIHSMNSNKQLAAVKQRCSHNREQDKAAVKESFRGSSITVSIFIDCHSLTNISRSLLFCVLWTISEHILPAARRKSLSKSHRRSADKTFQEALFGCSTREGKVHILI